MVNSKARKVVCSLDTVPEETLAEVEREKEGTERESSSVAAVAQKDISSTISGSVYTISSDVGLFGEVNIEESQDVHFGHKIFAAPITIVNKIGDDEEHTQIFQGPFADVISRSTEFFRSRYYQRYKHITSRQRATCALCGVSFAVAIATCIVVLVFTNNWNTIPETPELILNETWFISRYYWQAIEARRRTLLKLPVKIMVIAHTAMENCQSRLGCIEAVRSTQAFHVIDRRWDDIAYNYLIGGVDGLLFQGVGSNAVGTHTEGYNFKSIAVAFMGDFNVHVPLKIQLDHVQILIKDLVRHGKLHEEYWLVAACKINGMESPGINLVEILKTWPRWVENINNITSL